MSSENHDHGPIFWKVLVGLMVLTAVTVGLSYVHFGSKAMNIAVGLLVAVVKATLVVLFFMHLKWEKRWWLGMVLFPVALIMIVIFSNLPDTGMSNEHLTRSEKIIPHRGRTGAH